MDAAKLRDRLLEVISPRSTSRLGERAAPLFTEDNPTGHVSAVPAHAVTSRRRLDDRAVEQELGGTWKSLGGGRWFLVERRTSAAGRYGRSQIGGLAEQILRSDSAAALLAGGATRPPLVFFDLETTGLSGGAGTLAFLVGCGWFDDQRGFVTEQHLLVEPGAERPLLHAVAERLGLAGALVSFNGKSFDGPMLDSRYSFHRLEPVCTTVPHIDVLHPARRFWGARDGGQFLAPSPCSLVVLEKQVLGARRSEDVPGFDVPARYFQFLHTGDPRLLTSILEHNRRDLLALAGLTARLMEIVERGPGEALSAREALALGRVYLRAGLEERAREALGRAIEMSRAPQGAFDPIRTEGLRTLAIVLRRGRHFEEAAECWRQLLETRGCPAAVSREASEALAIHHEHRLRDLSGAETLALQSLEYGDSPAWAGAVHYRLARIGRKLETVRGACARLDLDSA
jgi:uncharacterized protein YprB with RNaseH-like and TPR domain